MPNEEKDSSEVFFEIIPSFLFVFVHYTLLTLREKNTEKSHKFFFLCVKLAGDYCVFMLVPSVLSSRRMLLP